LRQFAGQGLGLIRAGRSLSATLAMAGKDTFESVAMAPVLKRASEVWYSANYSFSPKHFAPLSLWAMFGKGPFGSAAMAPAVMGASKEW
jgi:hypothetical protein